MSPEAWSAIIAAIGVIVAIGFQILEWRRSTFARGLDTIASLDSRFESPEFREIRRRAAMYFLNPNHTDRAGYEAASTVLNFFETVAFLHGRRVVDTEVVWHFFASWLLQYYFAADQLIASCQTVDPACYEKLTLLYESIRPMEESKHPTKDTRHLFAPAALKEFLEKEASLELRSLPSTAPEDLALGQSTSAAAAIASTCHEAAWRKPKRIAFA